jgi:L-aminopeptidase/D-esterase-like protein
VDEVEELRSEDRAGEQLADHHGELEALEEVTEQARAGEGEEQHQQRVRVTGHEAPLAAAPAARGRLRRGVFYPHSAEGGHMGGTLTDVAGFSVGHWSDLEAATGCTVVLCPGDGAVAGVDVRGSAPGTRETDLLDPVNAVQRVHAVLIGGGSAFGLDAATGVMRWLEARGRGVEVGPLRVPLVPAAVLFDLLVGRPDVRPDAAAGEAACVAASTAPVPQGCVGAGTGATVGKILGFEQATKSGLGSASLRLAGGVTVGALVAVNAAGDVVDPASGAVLAGPRLLGGGFARTSEWLRKHPPEIGVGGSTTLAVVGTDAELTKVEVAKVARMAHDGLARTIDPVHTMLDGDTVFALATGLACSRADVTTIGAAAATALARAVLAAVRAATGLAGLPAAADVPPAANAGPVGGVAP